MKALNFHISIIFIAVLISVVSGFGSSFEIISKLSFLDFYQSGSYLEFLTFNQTFLENNNWIENIISGDYLNYYESQYESR